MNKAVNISIIIILTILILINITISKPKTISTDNQNKEIPKAFITPNPYLKPQKNMENIKKIPSIVSEKTIYLTFDDGPSYLTNNILNILEKENVPATFFVIGTHIDEYKNTIRKAYNESHTIAIHSMTHNYSYIYKEDKNYFDDLNQINNKIYDITGHHSHIVRLPGGSSNTVSKKYNQGIVTRITNELTKNNYFYFDWNVDSNDAAGKLSKEQIYNNVISHLSNGTNIILMHDAASKKTTVEALENIIKYAKQQGYTFAKITKETLPIKHHINN